MQHMTDEEYYLDTSYVSNSMLKWLDISPLYYKNMIKNIESGDKKEVKKTFYTFGNAVHCYLLEHDKFDERYRIISVYPPQNAIQKKFCDFIIATGKITDKVAVMAFKMAYSTKNLSESKITEKAKDLLEKNRSYIQSKITNDDRIVLTEKQFETIKKIYDNATVTKSVSDVLFGMCNNCIAENEKIILFKSQKYDINLKAKLDRIIINFDTKTIKIYDIKTFSTKYEDTNPIKSFKKSFKEFDYKRQLAFYNHAVFSFFKENFPKEDIESFTVENYIIAIQTTFLNEVFLFKIDNELIIEGSKEIGELLYDLKYYEIHGFTKRRKDFEIIR